MPAGATSKGGAGGVPAGPNESAASVGPATAMTFTTTAEMPDLGRPARPATAMVAPAPGSTAYPVPFVPSSRATVVG